MLGFTRKGKLSCGVLWSIHSPPCARRYWIVVNDMFVPCRRPDDRDFERAWADVISHVSAAKPEFIILQCGADSIAGDPLTGMEYSPASFTRAGRDLAALAQKFAQGRLLCLGGGGYNLNNIAAGWNNVIAAIAADR